MRIYAIISLVMKMRFVAKKFSELTARQLYEILRARSQIFMLEQEIHCQDMDRVDYNSRHYFIEEDGEVLAYLRAFYTDENTVRLGRVLTLHHGKGLGLEIMEKAMSDIRQNMCCKTVCLDSQLHAVGFYEKLGFQVVSDEFLEEGILHVVMQRDIG